MKTLIEDLKKIKRSIILGAGGGVQDVLWMHSEDGTECQDTICDHIDGMLVELGCNPDDLEKENESYYMEDSIKEVES